MIPAFTFKCFFFFGHRHIVFSYICVHVIWPFSEWIFVIIVALWEFFIYSRNESLVEYMACKCFIPSVAYLFIHLTESFAEKNVLNVDKVQLINLWFFTFLLWIIHLQSSWRTLQSALSVPQILKLFLLGTSTFI